MALKPLKTLNFGGEDTYYLDFKNVENMPFETVGGDTLTWDGNTEGLVCVDMGGIYAYKISDAVLTAADFANDYIATRQPPIDTEVIIDPDFLSVYEGDGYLVLMYNDGATESNLIMSATQDAFAVLGLDAPSGTYVFVNGIAGYLTSLTINGYTGFTTTTLKKDYVPIDYITEKVKSSLATWDGGEY